MNSYISHKLRIFSFLLILMVIFIHTWYHENSLWEVNYAFQKFIGSGISRIAVPFFFVISGYLFFLNIPSGFDSIKSKIRKRVKTLLIPYILWNIIFELIYLLLYFIPSLSRFVNSNIIEQIIQQDLVSNLIMIFWNPGGFHLWFLRDLILIVFLTPLFYLGLRKHAISTLIIIFTIGFLIKISSPFWFLLGSVLAVKKVDLTISSTNIGYIFFIKGCGLIYLASSILFAFDIPLYSWFNYLTIICGIISSWFLYDLYFGNNIFTTSNNLKFLTSFSFFIYCFHEPTLNILKKLPPYLIGQTQLLYFLCYCFIPFAMVGIGVSVGYTIKSLTPRLYSFLTGDRN